MPFGLFVYHGAFKDCNKFEYTQTYLAKKVSQSLNFSDSSIIIDKNYNLSMSLFFKDKRALF